MQEARLRPHELTFPGTGQCPSVTLRFHVCLRDGEEPLYDDGLLGGEAYDRTGITYVWPGTRSPAFLGLHAPLGCSANPCLGSTPPTPCLGSTPPHPI